MNVSYRLNSPDVVYEIIEGDLIVLNLRKGDYFSFNTTGSFIFTHIIMGNTISLLEERLADKFKNLRKEELLLDINNFVEKLCRVELLLSTDASSLKSTIEEAHTQSHSLLEDISEYLPPSFEQHTNLQDLLLLDPIHEVSEDGWPKQR